MLKTYKYPVESPFRKDAVKKLARGSITSFASSVASSYKTKHQTLFSVSRRIRQEMNSLCSKGDRSVIGSSLDGVENFSFDAVWYELKSSVPTLTFMLEQLISRKKRPTSTPFLCLVASMLLKRRSRTMALVQRMVSIFLYGNGATKQVEFQLQEVIAFCVD